MAKLNRDPLLKRITADRARWRARLQRFSLRFHVLLIVVATCGFAALVSRGLLALGMTHLGTRYAVVVLASYAAFCGLVRLWIAIVRRSLMPQAQNAAPASQPKQTGGTVPGGVFNFGGARSGSGGASRTWAPGGGGDFAGGGASGSFEMPAAQAVAVSAGDASASDWDASAGSSGGSSSSSSTSLDLGDIDGKAGLVLLAIFALLAVLASAALVVLWIGPGMLVEAALASFVTTGLARRSMLDAEAGWLRVVLGKTWWIAALILLGSVWAGNFLEDNLPGVRTAGEAVRWMIDR